MRAVLISPPCAACRVASVAGTKRPRQPPARPFGPPSFRVKFSVVHRLAAISVPLPTVLPAAPAACPPPLLVSLPQSWNALLLHFLEAALQQRYIYDAIEHDVFAPLETFRKDEKRHREAITSEYLSHRAALDKAKAHLGATEKHWQRCCTKACTALATRHKKSAGASAAQLKKLLQGARNGLDAVIASRQAYVEESHLFVQAQVDFCEISRGLLDNLQQREVARVVAVRSALGTAMARMLESSNVAARGVHRSRDAVARVSTARHIGAVAGGYGGGSDSVDPCPYPPHVLLEYTSLELTGALRSLNNELGVDSMAMGMMQELGRGGGGRIQGGGVAAAADGEGATAGEMAADRVVTQADVHVGVIEDNYTEAGREAKEGRHAAAAAAAASQSVNAVWKNKKRVVSIGASLQGNVTSGSGGMGGGGGGGGGLGSVPPPFFKQPTVRPVLGSRHAAHRARTPSGDPGDDPNGEEYT